MSESNGTKLRAAHEIWSAAQIAPGEGIEDAVARIAALIPSTETSGDQAPSDAEIEALWTSAYDLDPHLFAAPRYALPFARDLLARWGAPQPVQPADPMDWPLPCNVALNGSLFVGKGVRLGTLIKRMEIVDGEFHRLAREKIGGDTLDFAGVATGVSAPLGDLVQHLRNAAEDPMWADHAEVSKALIRRAADALAAPQLVERKAQPVSDNGAAITLRHMGTDGNPHQWYLDGPDFYCDVERDADGKWSVFIKDPKTKQEGWADQAESASQAHGKSEAVTKPNEALLKVHNVFDGQWVPSANESIEACTGSSLRRAVALLRSTGSTGDAIDAARLVWLSERPALGQAHGKSEAVTEQHKQFEAFMRRTNPARSLHRDANDGYKYRDTANDWALWLCASNIATRAQAAAPAADAAVKDCHDD